MTRSNGEPVAYFSAHIIWDDGCWVWTGPRDQHGYGNMRCGGRRWKAHRFAYEMHHGSGSAKGLNVCHSCDNPPCVTPGHFFLGDQKANMADAAQKGRVRNQNSGIEVCQRGHALTPENTYAQGGRWRGCRICQRARWREYADRNRERLLARRRELRSDRWEQIASAQDSEQKEQRKEEGK